MDKKVLFKNIEGKDYKRTNANITYISQTPDDSVSIDFFEEYIDSIAMITNDDQGDNDDVYIIREKKMSVVINLEDATDMARRILERFEEEEEEEENVLIMEEEER